jgi:phenylpropionate dioxygenase-like ring-hydroxylating dioxygenase large terminal subunit
MSHLEISTDRRFPFPLPHGWFAVGRLDELDPTQVRPARVAGTDLVVWHDGSEWHVFDAYCPHLGAHLGVGGWVDDGCLVCPFHEWRYGTDGTNVAIPYTDRPNRKARVRSYPTVVRNRSVLMWWHPDETVEPMWDVADVLDPDAVECMRFTRQISSWWQELAENAVDMAHFTSVHGLSTMGKIGELDIDGPVRRVHSSQSFKTARGEFEGSIESTSYGPGMGVVQFELMSIVTLVSTTTPLEDGLLESRFTLYHAPGDEMGEKIGTAFGDEVQRQFDQDIPIWEAKRYQPSPALAPIEKPITEFRRWASQFYARA